MEQGLIAITGVQYAAIGQPRTSSMHAHSLQVQTGGLSVPHEDCPRSSISDPGHGMRSPYTPPQEMFPEYAISYTDFPTMNNWFDSSTDSQASSTPDNSQIMSPPQSQHMEFTWSSPVCVPTRSASHTLGLSLMPIIASAIPKMEPITLNPISSDEWEQFQYQLLENEYLQLDGATQPLSTRSIGAKWSRKLFTPKKAVGRKLAGQWDLETTAESEPRKSIQTAPSILG